MRRLSNLDASFLALDSGNSVGHVCLVAVLDGDLELADLRRVVAARIDLVPLLRQRLQFPPLRLSPPYWVDDAQFVLDRHLHQRRLRRPGGPRQLAREVERVAVSVLDRDRPLWEIHLLRGLRDGRTGLVTKIHHAAVDGIGGRELLTALLDDEYDRPATAGAVQQPGSMPGPSHYLRSGVRQVAALPSRLWRLESRLLGTVPGLSALALSSAARLSSRSVEWLSGGSPEDDGSVASQPGVLAPATPFNRSISPERSWAFGRLSLDSSKPVRKAAGASVNDVVLAATAGALRRWLVEHDALPAQPLRAMVPVSVRTSDEVTTYGNRIALMMCPLPTNEPDPLERLAAVQQSTRVAKAHHAIGAERLQELTRFAVPALATRVAGVAARIRLADHVRLPMNLVVSNVPGSRSPLHLAGRELLGLYPVPPISDGLGLNVTVQGYRKRLHVGMTASPELIPDLWKLLRYLESAHQELADLPLA